MKDEFLRIYQSFVKRDGADKLMEWLEGSTFFDDPASSNHHLAVPGGLCRHSVNVYRRLKWLCDAEAGVNPDFRVPSEESIAIVALLHDLCKVGVYQKELKNKKFYDEEHIAAHPERDIKHDASGDYVWDTVVGYRFEDSMPYGHGEKSVYIISGFMKLTREEAFAIRYHMGSWNDGDGRGASKAFGMYELALLAHMADEFASFVDEAEE